jgi:uncharacterized protein (DUF2062 family)
MNAWVLRFRASLEDLSTEQIALLLSVGLVLGVFPILGCPTILCMVAALGLRLNFAALQLLNNISSPLQLALLLPLVRAGAWLCGAPPTSLSPAGRFGAAALHAVTGWSCICIPLGVVLYLVLISAMRKGRLLCSNDVKSPTR